MAIGSPREASLLAQAQQLVDSKLDLEDDHNDEDIYLALRNELQVGFSIALQLVLPVE